MSSPKCSLSSIAFILLCPFFLFLSFSLQSQTKLKWGNIPANHLSMEACSFEPDASSMVLIDQGHIRFEQSANFRIKMFKHKRIKIFDKSAFDQGDFKIEYWHTNSIRSLRAQVISKDGQVTKLAGKQIYDEKVNDYRKSKNFALPNVQEGSVLEIEYTLLSPYITDLFEWYFQEDIPVQQSELLVAIPKEYDYSFIFQGSKSPDRNDKNGEYLFTMNEVPSIKEEAYITSMDNYRNRIRFQLNSYSTGDGFKKSFMSTWKELNQDMLTHQKFGKRLKSKQSFSKIAEQYFATVDNFDTMSDKEKAESIFEFIQNKMTSNQYIGIVSSEEKMWKIFESGTGRVQEINMLVAGLLNHVGIESNLVMLPTRDYGSPLELYPFVDQFNYVVACATVGDEMIFMDASKELNPFGQLPRNALNTKGFMVDETGGKWVDLPIQQDKEVTYFKGAIDAEGGLTGTWTKQLEAYSCYNAKKRYAEERQTFVKTQLEDKFAEVKITNENFEELEKKNRKVKYSVDIEVPEACTVANDFMYFNPVLHTNFSENPFKLKERSYPVDMPYPFTEKFILSLQIPENFEIEELPESQTYALPDGSGTFKYSAKKMSNQIAVNATLNFTRRSFSPSEYEILKGLFEMIVNKQNEQIVLKKI